MDHVERLDIVPFGTGWCLTDSALLKETYAVASHANNRATELAREHSHGQLVVNLWDHGISRPIIEVDESTNGSPER